jgi:iron complex outermembrane receptor protein
MVYGPIARINSTTFNLGEKHHRVYDAWLEWPIPMEEWGNLLIRVDYSHVEGHTVDGEDFIMAGYRPDFRWNGQVGWSRGSWSVTTLLRYIDGLPEDPHYPGSELGSFFRINAQVSYTGFRNLRLTIGARNLANKDPAFDVFDPLGHNHYLYSGEKRFWYLRLEKQW